MADITKKLATALSGSQVMTDGGLVGEKNAIVAAWQTPENRVPKRVIIRCDGKLNSVLDASGNYGFPCAVLQVEYSVGGITRKTRVEALGESSLVVWAESVEVVALRDEERIAALAAFPNGPLKPCHKQIVAAAISAARDTSTADARYLVPLPIPPDPNADFDCWFEVPPQARLVRFLPGLSGADGMALATVVDWPSTVQYLAWTTDGSRAANVTTIEAVTPNDGTQTQTVFTVPAAAQWLKLRMPAAFFDAQTIGPLFIEWIMAPTTVSAQEYKI